MGSIHARAKGLVGVDVPDSHAIPRHREPYREEKKTSTEREIAEMVLSRLNNPNREGFLGIRPLWRCLYCFTSKTLADLWNQFEVSQESSA